MGIWRQSAVVTEGGGLAKSGGGVLGDTMRGMDGGCRLCDRLNLGLCQVTIWRESFAGLVQRSRDEKTGLDLGVGSGASNQHPFKGCTEDTERGREDGEADPR